MIVGCLNKSGDHVKLSTMFVLEHQFEAGRLPDPARVVGEFSDDQSASMGEQEQPDFDEVLDTLVRVARAAGDMILKGSESMRAKKASGANGGVKAKLNCIAPNPILAENKLTEA
jgi:hypothetical protein